MKARMKSGKIIKGKLAETFTRIGIASEIKAGRPSKKKVDEEIEKVPDDSDMISKVPDNKKFTDKKKGKK